MSGDLGFMEVMDSRFRGNDTFSRYPRGSEGPGLMTKKDSRFRGNNNKKPKTLAMRDPAKRDKNQRPKIKTIYN